MNVLVACECSQVVTNAFLYKGHNAFSCDILSCKGDKPYRHFNCDVRKVIEEKYLCTQDGDFMDFSDDLYV